MKTNHFAPLAAAVFCACFSPARAAAVAVALPSSAPVTAPSSNVALTNFAVPRRHVRRHQVVFEGLVQPAGAAATDVTDGYHVNPGMGGRVFATFSIGRAELMSEAEGSTDVVAHHDGGIFVGGGPSYVQPAFTQQLRTEELRAGVQLPNVPIYVALAAYYRSGEFPDETAGGFGLEALPQPGAPLSFYGRAYFYPNVNNEDAFVNAYGRSLQLRWTRLLYEFGATHRAGNRGYFTASLGGEWMRAIVAPSSDTYTRLLLGYGRGL